VGKLYVGLSGYAYKEWQGEGQFYPPGLKQREYLGYYASRYNALEADGTWYQMPSEASVAKWREGTPPGFKVSPKMHREVTHFKRLKPESYEAVQTFVKSLEPMEREDRLGPILVQLPPNLKRNDELLAAFLAELPIRDTLPWSVEFRHESWHAPEVEALLRKHGIGWVAADTDEANAQRRPTAHHLYVRLRKSDYPDDALREWAEYLRENLAAGLDCYVYCKHMDAEAPWLWADRLLEFVARPSKP
jgi:uncharacterized protein YecE (DUF72 family)